MSQKIKAEKCRLCPYKLGIVKCIVSPCNACLSSDSRSNPFEASYNDRSKTDFTAETEFFIGGKKQ